MGVNFVFFIENVAKRTQEEIDAALGRVEGEDTISQRWELITYRGKEYAEWLSTPRFFVIQEDPERWEALRKYLVRAMKFFGASEVLESNDVCWYGLPPEDEPEEEAEPGFYLPGPIWYEYLQEPDYEKMPELKDIKELQGLTW